MKKFRFAGRARAAYWALTLVTISTLLLSSCSPIASQMPPGLPKATLSGNATRVSPQEPPTATAGPENTRTPAPEPDLTSAPTQGGAPQVEGLVNFPDNVNPLTGLVVDDPSRLERRPVLVKVSNFPRTGRPHAGLSFADMVFEYYIGYGLNRFMGIYLSQDSSQVGPVRSGRLVDAQLAEMYQGLLFYGNADPQVDKVLVEELGARALADNNIPSPPKYRIGKVLDETTLFVNTAELTDWVNEKKLVSNTRRDLRGMIFSDVIHPVNKPANELGVQFWTTTRGEWKYDFRFRQVPALD